MFVAIDGGKVLKFRSRIRPDRFPAFLPVHRTHLTMLILASHQTMSAPPEQSLGNPTHGKLERLHETQRLVDRTSNGQIIHGDLPQDALGIDQVARAERDPLILDQTSVVARHGHITVRQQRDAQTGSEPSCRAGLLRPGVVRVLRVGRDSCTGRLRQ